MEVGLLWFDDDPQRRLEEKVLRAAMHYERKYGQPPNLCFVHPSVFNGNGNGKRDKKSGVKRARSGDLAQRSGDLAQRSEDLAQRSGDLAQQSGDLAQQSGGLCNWAVA